MLFKLRRGAGTHTQQEREPKTGDIVDVVYHWEKNPVVESELDLLTMFPNKFDVINDQQNVVAHKAPAIPMSEPDEGVGDEAPDSSSVPEYEEKFGDNVTDKFEDAEAAGLLVFCTANWYKVIDPDGGMEINSKRIRKKAVADLLKKFVIESAEE